MATPRGTIALATALFSGVVVLSPTPAAGQTFDLVGFAPGASSSRVYGVSADGRVAVGGNGGGRSTGFSWSRETGLLDFGGPGLPISSQAYGVSGDGAVVVGAANTAVAAQEAYRYVAGGFEYLGVQTPYQYSIARDANDDGSIVVGSSEAQGGAFAQAFRWTSTTGLVGLGFARPGHFASEARAISQDGTTIVGQSRGADPWDAFIWTAGTGMVSLPSLPGTGKASSDAFGVNHNGTIIVGRSGPFGDAAIWTHGVPVSLGKLPGSSSTAGRAVSDDGTVVACFASGINTVGIAAVWTPGRGLERLADYLAFHGVTIPEGVYLRECTGVSADGMTFVGYTGLPGAGLQGWVATVPGPGVLCAFFIGFVASSRRRRR